jgi:ABC-type dipeptide/oligopeptide/nickel transport system ATPase component
MKPTIIALKGRSKCGKTTTLTRVISMLGNQPSAEVLKNEQIGDHDIQDMVAIILIGGKKVGIITEGDVGFYLEIRIEALIKVECTIIICACRTRGSTWDVVQKYKDSHNDVTSLFRAVRCVSLGRKKGPDE